MDVIDFVSVDLIFCYQMSKDVPVSNKVLASLAPALTHLRTLELINLPEVGVAGFRAICPHLLAVTRVVLRDMPGVTDVAMQFIAVCVLRLVPVLVLGLTPTRICRPCLRCDR
jgi:hypothetical protein